MTNLCGSTPTYGTHSTSRSQGAGYYYGSYTANSFNVSSLLTMRTADELASAGVRATRKPSNVIEDFEGDWEKEWFTYRPAEWARTTHKLYDDVWKSSAGRRPYS